MPNLIEVQKSSYRWFVEQGLKEVFDEMQPIRDYSNNLELTFLGYRFDEQPKYTILECKERDATYAAPLRVTARLLNKETVKSRKAKSLWETSPHDPSGTFVINGAERVIVSQLVRSPAHISTLRWTNPASFSAAQSSLSAAHGSNMRPTRTRSSMSA